MKNYIKEAKKIDIRINNNYNYLQSYRIYHFAKYAELCYMNGYREIKTLDETSKEELDKRQRSDLKRIEEAVKEETDFEIKSWCAIAGVYAYIGFSKGLDEPGEYVWLAYSTYFLKKALKPIRLIKDIKLAGWIYDNREVVNEVIKEEVFKKTPKPDPTTRTINAPTPIYPTESVPYSKDMYENGIDLNNITELDNKQLHKLKMKAKKLSKRS